MSTIASAAEIAAILSVVVRREYPPGTTARRDAHPKHHGCVRAVFRVESDVPSKLRHGLFGLPATYDAWIRFSSGSPKIRSDAARDQRGMAIKLLGVPGRKILDAECDSPTQDFLLASYPRFFIRDVAALADFTRAAAAGSLLSLLTGFFLRGLNPRRWRLRELRALLASMERASDLLRIRYWSQTPYRLGPLAVKYSARPLSPPPDPGRGHSADFLRERLAAHLAASEARFEFMVQVPADPGTMPIEDATVEWNEAQAPFRRVATITIPPQRFDSDTQMALAENLSFTPWHSLPDHEPLGEMNAVRRVVYETISALRHDMNGVPRLEPHSVDLAQLGPLLTRRGFA